MFTALGFYPVTPASGQYVIGRPFVSRAALNLPNGRRFVISTEGLSDENLYVQSVSLNGRPLDRTWIGHDEIQAGGELHFVMGTEPNLTWGTTEAERPYSMSAPGR